MTFPILPADHIQTLVVGPEELRQLTGIDVIEQVQAARSDSLGKWQFAQPKPLHYFGYWWRCLSVREKEWEVTSECPFEGLPDKLRGDRPWGRCVDCGHDTRNGERCSFCERAATPEPKHQCPDCGEDTGDGEACPAGCDQGNPPI